MLHAALWRQVRHGCERSASESLGLDSVTWDAASFSSRKEMAVSSASDLV